MSELNAAMGLAILPYFEKILYSRRQAVDFYIENILWKNIRKIKINDNVEWNYSYFPIIFETTDMLLLTLKKLNNNDIFPRRYFYPSLNRIEYINGITMPISENISNTILCLPLFDDMDFKILNKICNIINNPT